jgi:hypothetical protein
MCILPRPFLQNLPAWNDYLKVINRQLERMQLHFRLDETSRQNNGIVFTRLPIPLDSIFTEIPIVFKEPGHIYYIGSWIRGHDIETRYYFYRPEFSEPAIKKDGSLLIAFDGLDFFFVETGQAAFTTPFYLENIPPTEYAKQNRWYR